MDLITLERGRTRATIAPGFGGRIAQIDIADGDAWLPLLYDAPQVAPERRDPLSWGCYVMAPWPNRIANGRFMFGGAEYPLPTHDSGHALHGLAFERPWQVEATDGAACSLAIELDERWPWPARIRQRIEVRADGVRIEVEVAGEGPFPAGVGWHPWFRREVRPSADVRVQVDAGERYKLSGDSIPLGRIVPVEDEYDLRGFPALRERRLDDCYRDVRQPMRIAWGDIELTMTSSANVRHAVVYTPAHAVCVEPQTCAIDAFNLDARGIAAGTVVVERDRPLVASTDWRWRIGP